MGSGRESVCEGLRPRQIGKFRGEPGQADGDAAYGKWGRRFRAAVTPSFWRADGGHA